MGELARRRSYGSGSGLALPEQGRALLGKVVVAGANPATPLVVGAAGVAAWQLTNIPNGNVPGVISHIPVIGHPITDALVWAGQSLGAAESVHVLGVSPIAVGVAGVAGGVGYLAGKRVRRFFKNAAVRNGLDG